MGQRAGALRVLSAGIAVQAFRWHSFLCTRLILRFFVRCAAGLGAPAIDRTGKTIKLGTIATDYEIP